MSSETVYADFMAMLNRRLKVVEMTKLKDQEKLEIISDGLKNTLSYKLENRSAIHELVILMKDLEKKKGIKISYTKIEEEQKQRVMELLGIEQKADLFAEKNSIVTEEITKVAEIEEEDNETSF